MSTSRKSKPGSKLRVATARQTAEFEKVFKRIQEEDKRREQEQRDAPRRNFVSEATRVGFTKKQADFLWDVIPDTRWMDRFRPIGGTA